jgi:hypothetical protein
LGSTDRSAPLPRPSPDVVYRELAEEVVLVNLETNRIFALNETGARFWQLLVAGCSQAEIVSCLSSEFQIGPDLVTDEIDGIIGALAKEGLIE